MTTGHILPGYGDPVSRLRRVRSAPGCHHLDSSTLFELKNAAKLTQREFDHIRENARQLWAKDTLMPTTYDTFFNDGEVTEVMQPRPSSSFRHNNPHPPSVFLTNRLHYIEGYHNPDTTLGKNHYRIDASLSKSAQDQRRAPRMKYVARPDSALVNQYKDKYGFKKILPPKEAQAAEAWTKLADDDDRDRVMEAIHEHAEQQRGMGETEVRPASVYPSMHRWMKNCGAEEHSSISRLMQTLRTNPLHGRGISPGTVGYNCRQDIAANGSYRFKPRLRRGDFSMHPDWPTSLPHHKVP